MMSKNERKLLCIFMKVLVLNTKKGDVREEKRRKGRMTIKH